MGKTTKYLGIISKSKEAKDIAAQQEQAEDAKLALQTDIQAAKKALRSAQREEAETIESLPFNSQSILQASRNVKQITEDLEDLQALETSLFTEEEEAAS